MSASASNRTIRINRTPVLTLWAAVVTERVGFDHDAALTLGRALTGSSAQMKGRALGVYKPCDGGPSEAAAERGEASRASLLAPSMQRAHPSPLRSCP
jgi:hypothetical protein